MKTNYLLYLLIFWSSYSFGSSRIIYTQNFEEASVGVDLLGNMEVKNFNAAGGAEWSYDLATPETAISGKKSAHLHIVSPGNAWYGLQFKIENAEFTTVGKGLKYKITFDIKSSTDDNFFQFYIQAQSSFVKEITIPEKNKTQQIVLESTPMDNSGNANFLWAFGEHANAGDIWIDNIVIEELFEPVNFTEDFNNAEMVNGEGGWSVGSVDMRNFGNGNWTFGLEEISGKPENNCVWMDIAENSEDWWTLQFRIENKFKVIKGRKYTTSFKIKSQQPNKVTFKIEGVSSFVQEIDIAGGNNFQEYTIHSPEMEHSGIPNFMWAFGRPTSTGKLYIDDITITETDTPGPSGLKIPDPETNVKMRWNGEILNICGDQPADIQVYNCYGGLILNSKISEGETSIHVTHPSSVIIVKYIDTKGHQIVKKLVALL